MMLFRRAVLLGATILPFTALAQATPVPITIAVSSNSLAYGGINIALKGGLFEKQGLMPKVITMDSGNAAMAAVLSGSAEFASAGPGEVLAARLRGQKVVLVANIYRGLSGSLVLSKSVADRLGPSAATSVEARLKALDGLSIATPSATSAYTHPYKSGAEAVGAHPRFLYMAQPAMVAALQAGAVQGIIAGAPFSIASIASGAGVPWISGPRAELPASLLPSSSACIETSEAYAAARPDIVRRMQAVFDALAAFIRDQPAEAERLLGVAYPQLDAATIQSIFRDEANNWSRPVMTADDVRQEIAIQVSSGSLKGVEQIPPASLLVDTK
jgi:ABC-type nitrate/sulfonate/bicarbonate transport system substrate-binding protein